MSDLLFISIMMAILGLIRAYNKKELWTILPGLGLYHVLVLYRAARSGQPKDERGRWTTWREWKIRRWSWTILILGIFLTLGMIIGSIIF